MSNDKNFEVTPIHYRQLDFLRLFRLCRSVEVFSRKRKMPIEYVDDDMDKNNRNSRSACRRLLRALIVKTFPDFAIRSNTNSYYLEFPNDARTALHYISSNFHSISRMGPEMGAVCSAYRSLADNLGGFIFPRFPYNINISFMYNTYVGGNTNRGSGAFTQKPRENFYRCGLACIEYRNLWNSSYDLIINAHDVYKKVLRSVAAKKDVSKKNWGTSIFEFNSDSGTSNVHPSQRSREILANAVATSANNVDTNNNNSQELFDRALQDMLSRREDGWEDE